jgi:hypothetical protein
VKSGDLHGFHFTFMRCLVYLFAENIPAKSACPTLEKDALHVDQPESDHAFYI